MLETILERLPSKSLSSFSLLFFLLSAIYVLGCVFFSRLSKIPGPLIRRLTSIPLWYTSFVGNECTTNAALHKTYGPIVIIAPNEIDIDDGAAVHPIYIQKGGFDKAAYYSSADIDGHATIFSSLRNVDRASRAKTVMPMFAPARLRRTPVFEDCVANFIQVLQDVKSTAKTGPESEADVELGDLGRRLAMDTLSAHVFGKTYGAVRQYDGVNIMRASRFVDFVVSMLRVFTTPPWFFKISASVMEFFSSAHREAAAELVAYVQGLVDDADAISDDNYQKRLLGTGMSNKDAVGECVDAIFAGTDTMGQNISSLIWHLVKYPQINDQVAKELETDDTPPLLNAVVRESLRLTMAVPARLPRIVPAQGWTYTPSRSSSKSEQTTAKPPDRSYTIPAGTNVGVSAFSLHHDPSTFASPREFSASRWMAPGDKGADVSLDTMNRDFFAFGAGSRQCIARNMAVELLTVLLRRIVESGVLAGAKTREEDIVYLEWFNSRITSPRGYAIFWGP